MTACGVISGFVGGVTVLLVVFLWDRVYMRYEVWRDQRRIKRV